jgi:diguanylate cyclase (GGDEF)-like protein
MSPKTHVSWRAYKPEEQAQLVEVANHDAFRRDVVAACAEMSSTRSPLCCMFVDADHFKKVNDMFGHDAGNRVLQRIADILRECVGEKGKCYRCGGEEFIALLPNFTEVEGAALSERVRQAVFRLEWGPSMPPTVTVSIGVAEHQSEFDPSHLEKRADQAMYRAKNSGRNRVATSSGTMLNLVASSQVGGGPLLAIVDGEKFIRDILSDFFQMEGYRVATFPDADAAITFSEAPAATFVSAELHDLKGAAVVRALKARHGPKPIIVMSSFEEAQVVAECFRFGCDEFVFKPFKVEGMIRLAARFAGNVHTQERPERM